MNPLVSVIIPTYNSAHFLKETIRSVTVQTYKNIEIILVDDGSTDNTKALFAEFEKLNVQCIYQQNQGASAARNTGLKIARGEYIQFLDADDLLHPQKIEAQINKMVRESTHLSWTLWNRFFKEPNENSKFPFDYVNVHEPQTGIEIMRSFGQNNWYIPTSSWLASAKIINQAGKWNPQISANDDGEFYTRVLLKSGNVSLIDSPFTHYRLTGSESLGRLDKVEKAIICMESWKVIHMSTKEAAVGGLEGYVRNGFYTVYMRTFRKYPSVANLAAREFDRMNARCFAHSVLSYRLLSLIGLHRTMILKRIRLKLEQIFRMESKRKKQELK